LFFNINPNLSLSLLREEDILTRYTAISKVSTNPTKAAVTGSMIGIELMPRDAMTYSNESIHTLPLIPAAPPLVWSWEIMSIIGELA
jgi:hypothetical protein